MRPLYLIAALCSLSAALTAATPFKQNDRVAFVGDSITHGGSYHTSIQTFYATRFPSRNVLCFNVGISGDNAQGGFQRASSKGDGIWENDVAVYQPTVATVMLGMNDVGGWQLESSKTSDELTKHNDQQLNWYASNYSQLLDNLETLGMAEVTLIKTSPYDQTMVNEDAPQNLFAFGIGKNDLILAAAEQVIDIEAEKRGYAIVDFNAPMLAINQAMQVDDPAYSIVGRDRVHPASEGHMVMAYTFLKEQDLQGPVASVTIDAESLRALKSTHCTVSNLKQTGPDIEFKYAAQSLPFPTGPYQAVTDIIPFESSFNQETLQIQGLSTGDYELHISGTLCGTFTSTQFNSGINLAILSAAPQVVQANEVHAISQQRAKIAGDIRAVVWSVGYLSKIKGHDSNDFSANQEMIQRIENGETPEGLWGTPSDYVKSLLRRYLKLANQYDALIAELEALSEPLYATAQPKSYQILVKRK